MKLQDAQKLLNEWEEKGKKDVIAAICNDAKAQWLLGQGVTLLDYLDSVIEAAALVAAHEEREKHKEQIMRLPGEEERAIYERGYKEGQAAMLKIATNIYDNSLSPHIHRRGR